MDRTLRDKVFVSYSHRDKRWLNRLQRMLKPLVRSGAISLWADTVIASGEKWRQEIESALSSTRVAVLLVSDEFLASDFIAERELPRLLVAAEEEGVRILWVYLRACHYEATPIADYQAAHDLDRPLAELSRPKQDRVLLDVCKRIQEAFTDASPKGPVEDPGVDLGLLSEREEVLVLPEGADGSARVLTLHLGASTLIGRCYASQLRDAARRTLDTLNESRVHWVLAWDDERLNQIFTRLEYRESSAESPLEIKNLTDYSSRKQSFAVTGETGAEQILRAGESASLRLQPHAALTFTSGLGSGRQQLFRLVFEPAAFGTLRIPVLQTAATAFLFPPTGGADSIVVRYLGLWIPLDGSDLARRLAEAQGPLEIRFALDDVDLSIASSPTGELRVRSRALNLARLLAPEEESAVF